MEKGEGSCGDKKHQPETREGVGFSEVEMHLVSILENSFALWKRVINAHTRNAFL